MNRWLVIALAMCVFGAGCGDDNDSVGPSSPALVFSALLSPANEVPPVTNSESSGRGAAQITFSGSTAHFYFSLTGFPADTRIVGAHIHPGAAGVNGPVALGTPITAAAPVPLENNGAIEYTATVAVDPAFVQQIVNNPAGFYFNVHSPLNPGGFTRGQLQRVQ